MKTLGFTLSKTDMTRLKLKAIRSGVWFRSLKMIDRALMNAVLRVVNDGIRSVNLARAICSVINLLNDALQNQTRKPSGQTGFRLARKLSQIAEKWGNFSAASWGNDVSFARFLTIMQVNYIEGN